MTDKAKLFTVAALCVMTLGVSVTGGYLLSRRSAGSEEVYIIDVIDTAEERAGTDALALSSAADTTRTVSGESAACEPMTESAETADAEDFVVNINTASAEELIRLKGIGEKTAAAIIEYRSNAPFERVEDIMNVKGIGEKKFEDIKEHICV